MNFLVDQNLPVVLADWIRANGHSADHVRTLGLANGSDHEIAAIAVRTSAIVITRDADFARLTLGPATSPRVVWVRIGNTTNPDLFERWARAWPEVEAALTNGDALVEVR
jgi:predicted nuclease of predicted toxin-antitoxin system